MSVRGRPVKYRIIKQDPRISQFSPRGRAGRPDEANLSTDEFEALRLADFMGLSQKEAARSMRVSQQTFSRILRKAHKVVAGGLVGGKIIKIQGGYYVVSSREDLNKSPTETVKELKKLPKRSV